RPVGAYRPVRAAGLVRALRGQPTGGAGAWRGSRARAARARAAPPRRGRGDAGAARDGGRGLSAQAGGLSAGSCVGACGAAACSAPALSATEGRLGGTNGVGFGAGAPPWRRLPMTSRAPARESLLATSISKRSASSLRIWVEIAAASSAGTPSARRAASPKATAEP